MSLIASASPWTNDDDTPKKRIPALRKTVKKMSPPQQIEASSSSNYTASNNEVEYHDVQHMDSIMPSQTDNSSRVNQLINQMSSVNADNDGNRLADFQPLAHPQLQQRADMQPAGRSADESTSAPYNPLQIPPPMTRQNPGTSNFSANIPDLGKMASNYKMIYEPSKTLQSNYGPAAISSGNIQGTNSYSVVDNKLMEKINYMIHMLEQQHNEKTSNITEEFVLYTFLGVFIIFIVDSFARTGKYTR